MKDLENTIHYAEWDKCVCDGQVYTIVIVPSRRVAFLMYQPESIESALYTLGVHYALSLHRNRDISRDIGPNEINSIVNRQGLTLPDEDVQAISFPSRLLQMYLV